MIAVDEHMTLSACRRNRGLLRRKKIEFCDYNCVAVGWLAGGGGGGGSPARRLATSSLISSQTSARPDPTLLLSTRSSLSLSLSPFLRRPTSIMISRVAHLGRQMDRYIVGGNWRRTGGHDASEQWCFVGASNCVLIVSASTHLRKYISINQVCTV